MAKEGMGCLTKVALVVVAVVAYKALTSAGGSSSSVAPSPLSSPVVPVSLDKLSAATLLQAYASNEVAADAKYKGKRFRVSGRVAAIKSDIADEPQVWLVSDLNSVIASGLNKSFAASLSKGDQMDAACTVTGSALGMPMLDCSGPQ
jgi:hypothetical protein